MLSACVARFSKRCPRSAHLTTLQFFSTAMTGGHHSCDNLLKALRLVHPQITPMTPTSLEKEKLPGSPGLVSNLLLHWTCDYILQSSSVVCRVQPNVCIRSSAPIIFGTRVALPHDSNTHHLCMLVVVTPAPICRCTFSPSVSRAKIALKASVRISSRSRTLVDFN